MENVREDCFPCGGGIGYRLRRKTVVEKGRPSKQQSFFCCRCGNIPGERGSLLSGRLHALGFLIE